MSSKKKPQRDAAMPVSTECRELSSALLMGFIPIPYPLGIRLIHSLCIALALLFIYSAYSLRLYPVETYGYLIHEFDPWFNYRAAEYLNEHGWTAFFHWFDYMSWYPLGRPVGSTIYPGLQITAVLIYRALNAVGYVISLNDCCVLIPAWFGVIATVITGLLAWELNFSPLAAAFSAFYFAVSPAHSMRSMAGAFDNECIAMAAMLLTFYTWIRALRTPRSWPIGVLAGLAYANMVAAWGGYIFVLNMISLHAGCCGLLDWLRNTYQPSLFKAYTLFFVVGTAIATRIPPVGMQPFKSLEQLSAVVVFILLAGLHVAEVLRRRAGVDTILCRETFRIRFRVIGGIVAAFVVAAVVIAPSGYFGPLSSRVRALFVAHTRTGNPLVDSVAEHQPMQAKGYWEFLHLCSYGWGLGSAWLVLSCVKHYTPAKVFVLLYAATAYYFSQRMARLIILSGPVACIITGWLLAVLTEFTVSSMFWVEAAAPAVDGRKKTDGAASSVARKVASDRKPKPRVPVPPATTPAIYRQRHPVLVCVVALLVSVTVFAKVASSNYLSECWEISKHMASPQIVFQATLKDGSSILVDDYYKSYLWLKDNTPEDARILAWWDYGYQITGIANRTTLADGNTWNHEHIATIGKLLTSPVKEAHSLIRHMADYVLLWTGQHGDLGKSPHMARIGNSVYRDICPNDPTCAHFGFYRGGYDAPSPMMQKSLLYNLHEEGKHGITVNPALFKEVYVSKYGLLRIFQVMNVSKESKAWVADPANRKCDQPGSWICRGQYPPAPEVQAMLAKRRKFGEDYRNPDDEYTKEYMKRMRMQGQ